MSVDCRFRAHAGRRSSTALDRVPPGILGPVLNHTHETTHFQPQAIQLHPGWNLQRVLYTRKNIPAKNRLLPCGPTSSAARSLPWLTPTDKSVRATLRVERAEGGDGVTGQGEEGRGGREEMVLERCALCVWCCLYACMLVGVYHVCIASVCGHVRRNIMCYAHTCMSV